jgi:hypothetical protein
MFFEQMQAEFSKKIQDAYMLNKADTMFAGIIREVEYPSNLFVKGAGMPVSFADIDSGTVIEPYIITGQEVKVINVGISYAIQEWAKAPNQDPDGVMMDVALEIMGRNIAQREAYLILKSLTDQAYTRFLSLEKGIIRKFDVTMAEKRIRELGFMADTVVMEPAQRYNLLVEENVDLARFKGLMQSEKYAYAGKVSNMDVYSSELISKKCLVFDKSYVAMMRAPIRVYFDNLDSPRYLVVERKCVATAIDPKSVVLINIRPTDDTLLSVSSRSTETLQLPPDTSNYAGSGTASSKSSSNVSISKR